MTKRIGHKRVHRKNFIREWRKYRNLTQSALAERLDCGVALISRIENGQIDITHDFLVVCAEALMCDPPDLIMRDPTDTEAPWSLWNQAKQADRNKIISMMKIIIGQDNDKKAS